MRSTLRIFGPLLAMLLLAGCHTNRYQCPMPSGVACMSAPDVYKVSDAPGRAGMDSAAGVMVKPGASEKSRTSPAGGDVATSSQDAVVPLPKPGDVIPIREQSRVMRIWIAPWVDSNGNLTMSTRVYTEIEPKRWSVGEAANTTTTNFFPLQVDDNKASITATPDSTATPGVSTATPGTDSRLR